MGRLAGIEDNLHLDLILAEIEDNMQLALILDYCSTETVLHGKEGCYSSDGKQQLGGDHGSPLGVLYDDNNGVLLAVH